MPPEPSSPSRETLDAAKREFSFVFTDHDARRGSLTLEQAENLRRIYPGRIESRLVTPWEAKP